MPDDYYYPTPLELSEDPLWVSKRPLTELLSILIDPVKWVRTYGAEHKFELKTPFAISIKRLNEHPRHRGHQRIREAEGGTHAIVLQSINNTNLMTIQAGEDTARHVSTMLAGLHPAVERPEDEFELTAFENELTKSFGLDGKNILAEVAFRLPLSVLQKHWAKTPIQTTILKSEGRGFTHFQIWSKVDYDSPAAVKAYEKMYVVAMFHTLVATVEGFLNDTLNAARSNSASAYSEFENIREQTRNIAEHRFPVPFRCKTKTVPTLYLGDSPTVARPFIQLQDDEAACELLETEYWEGDPDVTYEEAFSKPYSI